jgi:hypothetical protein
MGAGGEDYGRARHLEVTSEARERARVFHVALVPEATKPGERPSSASPTFLRPLIQRYGDFPGAWTYYVGDGLRSMITTGKEAPNEE